MSLQMEANSLKIHLILCNKVHPNYEKHDAN